MPRDVGLIALTALIVAGVTLTAQDADPLRTHHERAQSFQLAGDLARAEREYLAEVLPRALRRLGNLSGAEGRIDAAIELLDEAARLAPDDIDIQIDLAVAWLRKPDLSRAGTLARNVLAAAPEHPRALSLSGRIRLLAGEPAEAVAELRRSLDREARFETTFALALANLHLRNLETARALFDQMTVGSTAPDRLVLIGRAYLEAGYPALAADHFTRALRMNPSHASARAALDGMAAGQRSGAHAARGRLLLELLPSTQSMDQGRRRTMRAQLEMLVESAWHNLGVIYARRGETAAAADARHRAARWNVSAGATPRPAVDPNNAIGDAEKLLQAGDTGAAEHVLGPVLERTPELPAALRVLGLVRAAQGRDDEAEALLRRATEGDAREQTALGTLAEIYVARNEFERAIATLDRMPNALRHTSASIRLRAYLGAGRLAEARTELPDVGRRAGADEAARVADALLARNLIAEAETLLEQVRARTESSARLLLVLAKLRLRRGDAAGAEPLLDQSLRLDARSVEALRLLAQIASDRGETARAADLLQKAREQAPDSPEVLGQLAEAAARDARFEEALAAARRLTTLRPDDVRARHLLAVTLLQNQNWREAIEILASPPASAAGDPDWPLALGMAEFGRRNYETARAAFEHALALDPGKIEARYHLGLIAREQGRTADAIEAQATVLARDPAHEPAHLEIGTLYVQTGNPGSARRHLGCAIALNPGDPAPHYQLALLARREGDVDLARKEMQQFERKREKWLAAPRAAVVKGPSRKGGC